MAKTWPLLVSARCEPHSLFLISLYSFGKFFKGKVVTCLVFHFCPKVRVESSCLISRLGKLESEFEALQVLNATFNPIFSVFSFWSV